MAATYFALGMVTTLAAAAATLSALYFYLKSTRRKPVIRGYLDLIPDLTSKQMDQVQVIRDTFLPKVNQIRQNLRRERAAPPHPELFDTTIPNR